MKWDHLWGDDNSWFTIDNPADQDIVFECVQDDYRLFPGDSCHVDEMPI
jgi:hypothetical protein